MLNPTTKQQECIQKAPHREDGWYWLVYDLGIENVCPARTKCRYYPTKKQRNITKGDTHKMIKAGVDPISGIELIKNKSLKVTLKRKKLNRNKMDREISGEVRDLKEVSESGAIRVSKTIFSKASTDSYMKIYNEASKYYYRCTLPWDDNGYRLLSIEMYDEFTKRFKSFTRDYRQAVNDFIDEAESHVNEARKYLGKAFKLEDYKFVATNGSINRDMLEDQFALHIDYDTVTGGEDLRCNLTDADREVIAEQINASAMEKFTKSQEHIVVNLLDCVKAIHERLSNTDNTFRDTLIGNLEELVDIVPRMNISGDPAINELAAKCKAQLCSWDPQTLRDDDTKRADVSKAADKILDQAKGLL